MDTSYSLNQAIQLAEKYYQAGIPFAFEGSHGIGKSQSLETMALKNNIGYVDLRLTLLEETDLLGLPYRDESNQVTRYTKPIWLSMIEKTGFTKGLLAIEEINRADKLVRQPALQLLWDRRCLQWDLPSGWLPIATWNPSGEAYETFDLDAALLSRLVVIKIKLCPESWLEWARNNDINQDIIDYLTEYPEKLGSNNLTPRQWYQASQVCNHFPEQYNLLFPILGNVTCSFQDFLTNKLYHNLFIKVFSEDSLKAIEKLQEFLQQKPSLLSTFNEGIIAELLKNTKDSDISENLLDSFQSYLEIIPSDSAIAVFDMLKIKNMDVTKSLLLAFEGKKSIRNKTKSLMKHLFGEIAPV